MKENNKDTTNPIATATLAALLAAATPNQAEADPYYAHKVHTTAWTMLRQVKPERRVGLEIRTMHHDATVGRRTIRYLLSYIRGSGKDYILTCAADITPGKTGRMMDCNADGMYGRLDSLADAHRTMPIPDGTFNLQPEHIHLNRIVSVKDKRRTPPTRAEKLYQGRESRNYLERISYLSRMRRGRR
ncbi:TPA: hypothetical protein HA265_07455 [Candidatus Woesearchaeota archaeon]|nr:hypothetical protein [Candidatus Woesearchaeota archaeon]